MSTKRPKFSVIIPTYNCAAYLEEALGTVLAQTCSDWEVAVIDNHSKDDTVARVEKIGDARIKLFSIHNNGVIGASRNLGIASTTAPYVAFLDADDRWHPTKLARCLEILEKGYDLVCHGEIHFDDSDLRKDVEYGPTEKTEFQELLLRGNCLSTSAVVCSREILEQQGSFTLNPRFNTAEDYELWLRLMGAGAKAFVLREMLGEYRVHAAGASTSAAVHMASVRRIIEHHYREGIKHPSPRQRLRYAMRWNRIVAAGTKLVLTRGNPVFAAKFLFSSFTDRPGG